MKQIMVDLLQPQSLHIAQGVHAQILPKGHLQSADALSGVPCDVKNGELFPQVRPDPIQRPLQIARARRLWAAATQTAAGGTTPA